MKKNILLAFYIALLPAAAWAQEKTLYDINDDLLFLVESYDSCAERESACTTADLQSIKAGAENSLRDLVGLLKSKDYSRMILTLDQARALSVRARIVQERLAHIAIADESCNAGIYYVVLFLQKLSYLVQFLNPLLIFYYIVILGLWEGLFEFIFEFLVLVVSTPWCLLMTVVLLPSCLLWWL